MKAPRTLRWSLFSGPVRQKARPRHDPRRRFARENRINFEQLEARVVLANTSADGAFLILLDNAPGSVDGFDGNLSLSQSGLIYNSKTFADAVVQFAGTLHPVNGNKPTSVSAVFTFPVQSPQTYWWSVDAGANINDQVLFRVPVLSDSLLTGSYAWSIDVTYHFGGSTYSPAGSTDYSGIYVYVDRSSSEFGKGWYHQDLHELKLVNPKTSGGKVYLITGYGEPTGFDYNGTIYTREAGDPFFYTLTRTDGTDTYYTLVDKYGTELKFKDTGTSNTSAKLESIFDASGNEWRYTYTSGKLSEIKYMPTGDTTTFTYSGGYLTTITETVGSNSRAASVSISSGQLASITLPDPDTGGPLAAPVWSYQYSGATALITKTVDPVGSTTTFTYGTGGANETISTIKQVADTSSLTPYKSATLGGTSGSPGALLAVEDTFGQLTDERSKVTKFRANLRGDITELIDDDGSATKFDRDASERYLTKITTPDPDGAGALLALEVIYTYDSRGNRLSETKRAVGTTTVLAQQKWEYGDADYSLPSKHIDELGQVTKYTIGAKSGAANNRGKVLSMTEIVGVEDNGTNGFSDDAKTTYTYTTVAGHVGLLETATDPLGRITKHEYWTTNPHEGLLKKVTRNHGAQLTNNVQYEYDDFRNRDAVIDELGRHTDFLFDKLDRLIKRTDADPDAGGSLYVSPETEFAYDAAGNLIKTIDPLDNVTRSVYDRRKRLAYEIGPRPDNTTPYTHTIDDEDTGFTMTANWHDWSAGYNSDYRYHNAATGSSDYALWEFGSLDAGKNYEIFVTWPVFSGNATDAPYEILDVNSTVLKTMTLDQNLIPADETVASVAWQGLGVFAGSTGYKVKVKPSATGYVGADAVRIVEVGPTVKYEYDPAGNLAKSIDPLGNTTTFAYDDMNRRTSVTLADPDGVGTGDPAPVQQTQYYNNGLVKKEIDPLLNEMVYEPDALGRTVKITYPDPDGASSLVSPVTQYKYDAAGQLTYTTETHVGTGTTAYTHTIDDEDTGFSTTGIWHDWAAGYNGDYLYHGAASGSSDYALWEFGSLDATKNYEIFVTWPVFTGNATAAPYEILDASSAVLKTMTVDQNLVPGDETVAGVAWQRLGVFTGSTGYKVKVKPSSTGYVGADAVRIVEVGRTTQYFYDGLGYQNAIAQPKATGTPSDTKVNNQNTPPTNWTRDTTSGYQGDHLHRDAGPASEYAEWSFNSLNNTKTYAVYASWLVKYDGSNMPLNASDARYEVRESGSLKATFFANQKYEPADEITDTNIKWSRIGFYQPGATSLTIRLPADANGKLVADGVRLVELGPVSRTVSNKVGNVVSTIDPLGSETIYRYDDLDRMINVYEPVRDTGITPHRPTPLNNHSSVSGWTYQSDARAYGGDYLQKSGGGGQEEYFSLSVPSNPSGRNFAVLLTWVSASTNYNAVPFTIKDSGDNTLATIDVDQTIDPADYQDETGRWWEIIGYVSDPPVWNILVETSPGTGGQADAARLIEVGPAALTNKYDAAGNLTQVTDAKNNDTWFYRDDLNRVKEEKNEFNESRYFEFYADSRLKKATDRNGRVIEHFYDNLGRQTEERWKNGAATVRSLAFGYDANSRLKSADDDGTAARDYDWFYDNLGRITESEFATSSYTWEFKQGYDTNSNRDSRELLQSGTTQFTDTFTWDNLNRQTKLARDAVEAVNWGRDLRAEFKYKADGQLDQIKRFNVTTGGTAFVTSDYGYDSIGRLTSLDHKNSAGTSIAGYVWQYDAFGRMTSLDFTNSTYNYEDVTFGYDRTHQVTSADRSGTSDDEAYAYDGAGNRTTANGATYTTDPNNCLTYDGTFTYTYDDEGNRLTRVRWSGAAADDKTVEYTWDYRNRLEKVTFKRNDGTVTKTVDLRYDVLNRLTQKVVDPDGSLGSASLQTDDYLWNGDELVGVYGYNFLVFASGPAPDMVLFESVNTLTAVTLYALLGDHQNTVRDVLNTSGWLENHLVYNSYGQFQYQTGSGYSPFHRFMGKPFDVAVGLQYNVNRWYDPGPGRWISEDPIGFAGGHANLNMYIANSPVNGTDRHGLQGLLEEWGGVTKGPTGKGLIKSKTPREADPYRREKFGIDFEGDINADLPNFVAGAADVGVDLLPGSTAARIIHEDRDPTLGDLVNLASQGVFRWFKPVGKGKGTVAISRPTPNTSLPSRVIGELPAGGVRTPQEVAQARNFFERNRDAAKKWWSERNGGREWPGDATHAEHPRPLKDGGDPLFIEPGYGGPNAAHQIPRPEYGGLTDAQRWGQMGGRPKNNP